MKLFQPNDYAIWKRSKIVKLVEEQLHGPDHFMGAEEPIHIRLKNWIVAGLTEDQKIQQMNDESRWLVRCDQTDKEFVSFGFDLIYVNEMQLIALMAKKGETDEGQ